jgi:thioredoxin-dependent peroxiredoxin
MFHIARRLTKAAVLTLMMSAPAWSAPPAVGQTAPEFALRNVQGAAMKLSDALAKGPVVLVVLRGFPGYQCPFCNRQAQDFIRNAKAFADAGYRVMMVYPGAAENLEAHAKEFAQGKNFPESMDLLIDPGYQFTQLYDLRWNAPNETAYPSTFILNRQGVIVFAKTSKEHGGRTTAEEILHALPKDK